MAGLDILDPTAPLATQQTLEQRIAKRLEGFRARLSAMERTRPVAGAGEGEPTEDSQVGTRWFDTVGRRAYVKTETGWYSTDSPRSEAYEGTTVTTSSTSWVDLGGPSLTFYLPAPGLVSFQLDVEMWSTEALVPGQDLPSYTDAAVGLVLDGGAVQPVLKVGADGLLNEGLIYNRWIRMLSAPGRSDTDGNRIEIGGAAYPLGGFITTHVGQGEHTWSLRYRAEPEAGAVQAVHFTNRRIWAAAL